MKKIVPFKKDMLFNSNVSEITSISLEHNLKVQENNSINGKFIINGEYKMSDSSINTEGFNFELPCNINLDERYDLSNVLVDIDDFYYEIVNSNILEVNIDVLIDKLEEKQVEQEILNEIEMPSAKLPDLEEAREEGTMEIEKINIEKQDCKEANARCIEEEDLNSVTTIFDSFNDNLETYQTYKVYIVREGDTLDSIIQKYGITKDDLEQYNDLSDINLGDKIIIPDFNNAKD
ncbi:MAG: LysM peptidoglycan-binding domain-containing protein [Firmicutes bacterium]|nr:LysM peptidoglycan-binding domain-containing protein [Bacillota bacterium]